METWVYETLFAAKNIDHFEVASELVDFRVEPLVDQDIFEYPNRCKGGGDNEFTLGFH